MQLLFFLLSLRLIYFILCIFNNLIQFYFIYFILLYLTLLFILFFYFRQRTPWIDVQSIIFLFFYYFILFYFEPKCHVTNTVRYFVTCV